ncbi:Flp pilus assembly protein CpaB [Curvivirga aplysinae]|uniref:Flp pilus assembly protein CpaB n=1 Tax=Curvivirga aplysinae TaxID=2529852 RepID=UPI0012BB6618|nr:Flp pilus assembly protein CpaB [Curvivirga aplysinae]MTI08627.1 Flp pilus assembly protein CpaB [Curvivirga aplysinae]
MNMRTILMLALAVGSAGGTGYSVLQFIEKQRQKVEIQKEQIETVIVEEKASLVALVPKIDMQAGQFVHPEDLEWQPWPEAANNERYVTLDEIDSENELVTEEAIDSFSGGVVRAPILKGQPIQQGQVVFPGDRGFLAAVLEPGKKAVSVSIKKGAGVSGLVFPGDRVDVLVALRLKGTDIRGDKITRFASTTMLEDVRVLSIDQNLAVSEDEDGMDGDTATIEVTEEQAREMSIAREMGQVSLALRSLAIDENTNQAAAEETPDQTAMKTSYIRTKTTDHNVSERNYTLDTEIFTINGRDMSMIIGSPNPSQKPEGVVVLRGNKTEE